MLGPVCHCVCLSFVTYYGGWVVPDRLLDRLITRVYMCTAVTVDALTYEHNMTSHSVAIIGDPTQSGPQINDGLISGRAGQHRHKHVHAARHASQALHCNCSSDSRCCCAVCVLPVCQ